MFAIWELLRAPVTWLATSQPHRMCRDDPFVKLLVEGLIASRG